MTVLFIILFIVLISALVGMAGAVSVRGAQAAHSMRQLRGYQPAHTKAWTDVSRWHQAEIEAGNPVFVAMKERLLSSYLPDPVTGERAIDRVDVPVDDPAAPFAEDPFPEG